MIVICTMLFDLLGVLHIEPLKSNSAVTYTRRVSRVATLDGGAAINDRGYSASDETLVYRFKPVSQEHDDRAQRIVRLHPTVRVSNRDGVFEATPEQFQPTPAENILTLLVIKKLSED